MVGHKEPEEFSEIILSRKLRRLVAHCNNQSFEQIPAHFLLKTCFEVQKSLRKSGRQDNIFNDPAYERFNAELTTYLESNAEAGNVRQT